ncbi:MAG: tetratricopeptide repeat protein [Candidatus Kapaibacteriota bacterium]
MKSKVLFLELRNRIILTKCLILFTALVFFSCLPMQNVRKGSYNVSSLSQKKSSTSTAKKATMEKSYNTDTLEQFKQPEQQILDEKAIAGNTNYSIVSCEDLEFTRMKMQKLEEEIYMLRVEISHLLEMMNDRKETEFKESPKANKTKTNFSNDAQNKKQNKNSKVSKKSTEMSKKDNTTISKVLDDEINIRGKKNIEEVVGLIKAKKYDEAINTAEKYLSQENDFLTLSTLYYWKGEALFHKKEFSKAMENFQRVLAFSNSPKRIEAQIMIAECYTKQGKLKEAKKEYQRFIEDYPFSEFAPRAKRMIQQL